ncbi:hypothetical protein CHH91_10860 [Virgibacillus sp. 7505]|uniref:hypothetical protein n=1 Tax=Virgibacillus sp. 7505 TaxID=2022548 RepID=UPI000BA672EB|nr:hypothetical protein [Virgibacillus sp. 7505]PAE16126.1 hypothetical protein CHH91_10860 [Virgibacillus sp. 7505]
MIRSKKMLWVALFLFIVSIAISFPFPHRTPYGDTILSVLNFTIRTVNGLNFIVVFSLTLFIASLFFLTRSLKKFHKRAVLVAIILVVVLPQMIISTYQKTFAEGIDAVYYNVENSNCEFEMVDESTLSGECNLSFENYSSDDVQFTLEFHEDFHFEDDVPMVSLMNNKAPYEISLDRKEIKVVKIKTDIDVSNIENHVESGNAFGVNIIIKSGEKMRKL